MAVPIIDGINMDTFHFYPMYTTHFRGIFEWGFLYKESQVPQQFLDMREHDSEPYQWVHVFTQHDNMLRHVLILYQWVHVSIW